MLQLLHPFHAFFDGRALADSERQATKIRSWSVHFLTCDEWEDAAAKKEMEMIMEIITCIRNIRGEMRIAPSTEIAGFHFSAAICN